MIKIYDIPIYRISEDAYDKESSELSEKLLNDIKANKNSKTYLGKYIFSKEQYNQLSWQYNEIIAYICIGIVNYKIVVQVAYQSSKNKIVRNGKRDFKLYPDEEIYTVTNIDKKSNDEINLEIDEIISKISKSSKFKKRYIDLEIYNNIKNSINYLQIATSCKM